MRHWSRFPKQQITASTVISRHGHPTGWKTGQHTIKLVLTGKTIDGYTFKATAISDKVFKKAASLKRVVIGANVKNIGKNSFSQCKKLAAITFKGTDTD